MNNRYPIFLVALLLLPLQSPASDYLSHPEVTPFIKQLQQQHGYPAEQARHLIGEAKRQDKVLAAFQRPAEKSLSWAAYQNLFVTAERVTNGRLFAQKNRSLLQDIEQRYHIPAAILVAILGIETNYGKNIGSFRALDSLVTLSFDYPPRQRFFRQQLVHFLLLGREEKLDLKTLKGSYAAALGVPQFIPSSYRNFAIDGDRDGRRDLWHSLPDVLSSVANYFQQHKWQPGQTVAKPITQLSRHILKGLDKAPSNQTLHHRQAIDMGLLPSGKKDIKGRFTLFNLQGKKGVEYWLGWPNFYTITRYNHSLMYALVVHQLSQKIALP